MPSESEPRRVLAMGGGGFTMNERTPALDRFVLTLTEKPCPKICFLPTASGDPREQVTRFYERFGGWPCETTTISLFRLGRDRIDPIARLLEQDAIYVGGGSMRNMLAIWREHGIDSAMRTAWERGILLAGLSAGAMCWFEGGVSMSGGAPEPVAGLGFIAGSMTVHLDGEVERLPTYRAAVAGGKLPPGYAADDGAAVVFRGNHLSECVASRAGARVVRVTPDGAGGVHEERMPVRLLPGADGVDAERAESDGVAELRALRAGRRRWD
ncbi:MAG TPA: peptidase E [Solirubrobacteraceae bacterium]|jgi:peptidase E|nr:peptidase E [Solirubrobacteraceae bacterium]